jgi:hypothetical protein
MARKWFKRVLGGILVTATLWACDEWTFWDDMFKRDAVPGPTNRGWTGGDGAFSAALPNNREFWAFGDSPLTSWSSQGFRTQLGQPDLLLYSVYGNTIAVQNDRANPSSSSVDFYARVANATCVNTAVANITSEPPSNGNYKQYFNHAMLGLPNPPVCRYLWPTGAECLNCDNPTNARLLVGFYEWEPCAVGSSGCSAIGTKYTGNVIARIKNLDLTPPDWLKDGNTLYIPRTSNNDITWGVSFLKDTDGNVYIYGFKPVTDQLFVARSSEATLLNGNWPAWRTRGTFGTWSTDGLLGLRTVATKVAPGALSVDRVTRGGKSSYLLVHSSPGRNHHLFARTTAESSVNGASSAATWSDSTTTTPRIDLASIESSLGWQMLDLISRGQCEDLKTGTSLAPDWRAICPPPPTPCPNPRPVCGLSYHGLAHFETAYTDASGPVGIPASYIIPIGANPFFDPDEEEDPLTNPRMGNQDARYYRPKFTWLDVPKLKPWCTSNCWEGIVKEWPRRQIGGTETDFMVDLQSATKIWAQLTRISGNATMKVQFFSGLTLISQTTCTVSAPTVTCNDITKPPSATWAEVVVMGVATDEFKLRVHHAGTY